MISHSADKSKGKCISIGRNLTKLTRSGNQFLAQIIMEDSLYRKSIFCNNVGLIGDHDCLNLCLILRHIFVRSGSVLLWKCRQWRKWFKS